MELGFFCCVTAPESDRNPFTRSTRGKQLSQKLRCSSKRLSTKRGYFIADAEVRRGEIASGPYGSETERECFPLAVAGKNPPAACALEGLHLCARGMLERVCQQRINHRSRQERGSV